MPIGSHSWLTFAKQRNAKVKNLVLRFEVEFAFIVDTGLQHSPHRDLGFVKNIGAKLVQQVEEIQCCELRRSESGEAKSVGLTSASVPSR